MVTVPRPALNMVSSGHQDWSRQHFFFGIQTAGYTIKKKKWSFQNDKNSLRVNWDAIMQKSAFEIISSNLIHWASWSFSTTASIVLFPLWIVLLAETTLNLHFDCWFQALHNNLLKQESEMKNFIPLGSDCLCYFTTGFTGMAGLRLNRENGFSAVAHAGRHYLSKSMWCLIVLGLCFFSKAVKYYQSIFQEGRRRPAVPYSQSANVWKCWICINTSCQPWLMLSVCFKEISDFHLLKLPLPWIQYIPIQ